MPAVALGEQVDVDCVATRVVVIRCRVHINSRVVKGQVIDDCGLSNVVKDAFRPDGEVCQCRALHCAVVFVNGRQFVQDGEDVFCRKIPQVELRLGEGHVFAYGHVNVGVAAIGVGEGVESVNG